MLGVTHAAIGGAVGVFISNPAIAFGAGVVSHIIIDKTPHFWPKNPKYQGVQIVLDAISTMGVLVFLLYYLKDYSSSVFWGAMGGVSVDFFLVLVAKLRKDWWESKLRRWHERRQPHRSSYIYALTDIAQTLMGFLIIFWS